MRGGVGGSVCSVCSVCSACNGCGRHIVHLLRLVLVLRLQLLPLKVESAELSQQRDLLARVAAEGHVGNRFQILAGGARRLVAVAELLQVELEVGLKRQGVRG